MANQRSKKRNALIGVYVEPEVKARVEQAAKDRNLTVADYIRYLLRTQQDKEKKRNQHDND